MKACLTLLLVFWSMNLVKADVGSSALYKCRINTESSGQLTGYFQIVTGDTPPATDKDLLAFLKSNQYHKYSGFLKLYSQIEQLEYPTLKPDIFKYSAAPIEGTKLIKAEQIQSLTILARTASEYTKERGAAAFAYSKTEFLIGHYHPIIELSRAEIDLLNSQTPFSEHYQKMESYATDAILVLNYNPDLDETSCRKLSQKLNFKGNESLPYLAKIKARQEHFEGVRDSLRKQKIILIQLMSYP